ncbi:uncharacterized protein LOC124166669 isoform X2 [Ischnura elegans]|uniref:uncharacterized protein LOC124166669 isoform X2 n=1 Tax=Ischnura elegans TaxID=197161 RepID=UPI001ED8688D|nr:uncharacterized protein LOC124166669 isoform X2 [Ischnura elegans]
MDRNSRWINPSRRTTMMGEKRSGSSKKSQKNLLNPLAGLPSNKENENRGLRRTILGTHGLLSKNQAKEVSSRRSITRRLSFQKSEMDMGDESFLIHSGSNHDNLEVDESMLFPLNSTAVSSAPSPYRLDLLQSGDQKPGYPRASRQLNSSKYDYTKRDGDKKIGLSDETKELLRKMGIDTSPTVNAAKQDSALRIPERKSEEIKASEDNILDVTITAYQKSEVSGNLAAAINIRPKTLDKDTQTAPEILTDRALLNEVTALKSILSRHLQEREELHSKQNKEIVEFLARFKETSEAEVNKPMEKLSYADESRTLESKAEYLNVCGVNNLPSNVRIELSSVPQPSPKKVSSPLWKPTVQGSSQKEAVASLDNEQPPTDLISILSPHGCDVKAEIIPSPIVCNTACTAVDNCKSEEVSNFSAGCITSLEAQTWQRSLEVSFLDTPRSGRWLVTEDLNDNLTSTSTPTLGLNSMLKGMTIQGQQSYMETPETRRFVTQRILKGVESLFQ